MEVGAAVWYEDNDSGQCWKRGIIIAKEGAADDETRLKFTIEAEGRDEDGRERLSRARLVSFSLCLAFALLCLLPLPWPHSTRMSPPPSPSPSAGFAEDDDRVFTVVIPKVDLNAEGCPLKLANVWDEDEAETEGTATGAAAVLDLITLTHLHEPAILDVLQQRFDRGEIYTNTGNPNPYPYPGPDPNPTPLPTPKPNPNRTSKVPSCWP
jgi:hypothetical protein